MDLRNIPTTLKSWMNELILIQENASLETAINKRYQVVTQLLDDYATSSQLVWNMLLEELTTRAESLKKKQKQKMLNIDAVIRMIGRANYIRTCRNMEADDHLVEYASGKSQCTLQKILNGSLMRQLNLVTEPRVGTKAMLDYPKTPNTHGAQQRDILSIVRVTVSDDQNIEEVHVKVNAEGSNITSAQLMNDGTQSFDGDVFCKDKETIRILMEYRNQHWNIPAGYTQLR